MSGLGFAPDIAAVDFPIGMFMVESDIAAIERDFMKFAEGLTSWRTSVLNKGNAKLPMIEIEGEDHAGSFRKFNTLFLKRRWGDGLPLIPPHL